MGKSSVRGRSAAAQTLWQVFSRSLFFFSFQLFFFQEANLWIFQWQLGEKKKEKKEGEARSLTSPFRTTHIGSRSIATSAGAPADTKAGAARATDSPCSPPID